MEGPGIRSFVAERARRANEDGRDQDDFVQIHISLNPAQKLRDTVNLIVVASVWKGEQFIEEVVKPGGVFWQMNLAGFYLC